MTPSARRPEKLRENSPIGPDIFTCHETFDPSTVPPANCWDPRSPVHVPLREEPSTASSRMPSRVPLGDSSVIFHAPATLGGRAGPFVDTAAAGSGSCWAPSVE